MSNGKNSGRGMKQSAPEGYVKFPMVFISVPWNGETEEYPAWVSDACNMALKEGYLPVAPYGMYSSVINGDTPQKGLVVSSLVLAMVSACTEFWAFDDGTGVPSVNQAEEMMRAIEFSKLIRYFCVKEGQAQ